jgi:hypothetical protein
LKDGILDKVDIDILRMLIRGGAVVLLEKLTVSKTRIVVEGSNILT